MTDKLTEADVAAELNNIFKDTVDQIEPVSHGHFSEAFFFTHGSEDLVVRFAPARLGDSLAKDHYVSTRLVASDIPVAEFLYLGESLLLKERRSFAVTRRASGKITDDLSPVEFESLVPALVSTLDAIHQSNIDGTEGWGNISSLGVGQSESWVDFLLAVGQEREVSGYHHRWYRLFDESFLEKPVYDDLYRQMKKHLARCPQQRWLVHADYGFDNVLAENANVTAVIDWANAIYGDFMFDIARQELLLPEWNFLGRFLARYQARGQLVPDMDERLRCYQCYFVMDSMRFYASINSDDGYRWIKEKARDAGIIHT